MSNIRIINLKDYSLYADEILIKVDRSTPLGSPYYLKNKHNAVERAIVIDNYRMHFERIVYCPPALMSLSVGPLGKPTKLTRQHARDYLQQIIDAAKQGRVALGCWCYPEDCHARIIKQYVDNTLKEEADNDKGNKSGRYYDEG